MTLLQASFRGLQLDSPHYDDPYPVDFAVTRSGLSLITFAGWWDSDWGPGSGIELYFEDLIPEVVPVGSEVETWRVGERDIFVSPPADADMAARVARARASANIFRFEYLKQLDLLQENAGPDLDLSEWKAAIEAQEPIDAAAQMREQNYSLRKIGSAYLLGREGVKLDVLVIDEFGNATTVVQHPWFHAFAEDWIGRETRPDMEDYLAWLVEQRPSMPASVGDARIEVAAGDIEEIAARMLAGGA